MIGPIFFIINVVSSQKIPEIPNAESSYKV